MKTELTSVIKILDTIYKDKLNHIFSKQELKTMVEGLSFKISILVQRADDTEAGLEIFELIEAAEHLDDLVKEKLSD